MGPFSYVKKFTTFTLWNIRCQLWAFRLKTGLSLTMNFSLKKLGGNKKLNKFLFSTKRWTKVFTFHLYWIQLFRIFLGNGLRNGFILRGRKCGGDRRKDRVQSAGIVFQGRKSKILQQGSYFLLHKQHSRPSKDYWVSEDANESLLSVALLLL